MRQSCFYAHIIVFSALLTILEKRVIIVVQLYDKERCYHGKKKR